MASTYSKKFRAAAVAGASALVLGGTALLAAPATAASAPIAYKCPVGDPPIFTPELTMNADTDAPATLPSGSTKAIALTGTSVTVDGATTDLLRDALTGKKVSGTAKINVLVDGVNSVQTVTLTETDVPTTPGSALAVPVTGSLGSIKGGAAGTTSKIEVGGFEVSLAITKADDTVQPFDLVCAADAGQDMTVDTYENTAAVAVATKTKVTGKYVKAKKTIQANVAVTGTKTGKVTVTLKLGKKVVKKSTVSLKAGKAAVKFAKIKKKGKYTIEAKLAAGTGYKASSGKTTVTVR
ncbi:MAG: hypothetical protein ACI379_17380 [Nocardioides sp.]|uniref:hypothetical protein n=1 Tax=Nocardioides sp. TaxID=35761 RepID=UPI003F015CA8